MSREIAPPKIRLVGAREWNQTDQENEARQSAQRAQPYRTAVGVDLAYSEYRGDFSSIIVVSLVGAHYYVRDLIRCRRDIIHLRPILQSVQMAWPGAQMCSYIATSERLALAELARDHVDERTGRKFAGVFIHGMLARHPKHVRAQVTAELWGEGRIVTPPRAWTTAFFERMQNFTGAEGQDDNDTDALVSAIDFLIQTAPSGVETTGSYQRTRV